MAKQKYYVVWHGRKTGIFDNWEECNAQIGGFPQAKYKSFEIKKQAEEAFKGNPNNYIGTTNKEKAPVRQKMFAGSPILESLSVDGAWNTATGVIEYQGVYTKTKENIFRQGPYQDGTNNIAEFLGLVHALAYCKKNNLTLPIYSDSRTAISWVKNKKAKTNHKKSNRNKELFDMLDRAEKWLHTHTYENKILKWETASWGENPADFGRK